MKRLIVWIAFTLFCVVCTLVATEYWQRFGPLRFDSAVWREGEHVEFSPHAPRLRMADRLLASHTLLGKTSVEVEAMLGPPTQTDYFKEYDRVYWLGAERGLISIDSEWLVMRLGNGKVVEARIVSD